MIIFAGHQEKGFFCKEVTAKKGMEFVSITECPHIAEQSKEILQYKESAKYIIYELEQYVDDPDVIVSWILKIQEAIHVKTILFVPGYSPESRIVYDLYQKGIRNFIFSIYLGDQKEDLELCISGYFETFGYENRGIDFDIQEKKEEESQESMESGKMIGIAGAVPRMGTTTQAIQSVKYLQYCGHSAAYIQMNAHHFVEDLAAAYSEAMQDEDSGVVSYQGVDMYYRLDKLQEILKKEYEFFVFDYGVYKDPGFNKISFLEKEIQIFVVGSKPGEFDATYDVIQNNFYSDNFYIFNFVATSEQKDLLDLMAEKADVTFFAEEARDPFAFSGNTEMYGKMIPVEQLPQVKKKKKSIFKKRRGGFCNG